jgi:DNA-binding response OmpR family regulator
MRLLLRSFPAPVARQEILTTAWPHREDGRVLDTRMHRLRNRIAPLGLTIHTVRSRGFMLDLTPAEPDDLSDS